MRGAAGVFITATDTGAGKTLLGCLLALELRRRGVDVGVAKPFAAGGRRGRDGRLVNPDVRLLARFAASGDNWDAINPVCLRQPLAPAVAARLEGVKLDAGALLRRTRKLIRGHEFTLVEGCGGLLVPLAPRLKVIELIARLALPALIVARAGLGTINHTLLTVAALRERKIPIAAIVLNQTAPRRERSMRTNAAVIAAESGLPVFGPLPYLTVNPLRRASLKQFQQLRAITALIDFLL